MKKVILLIALVACFQTLEVNAIRFDQSVATKASDQGQPVSASWTIREQATAYIVAGDCVAAARIYKQAVRNDIEQLRFGPDWTAGLFVTVYIGQELASEAVKAGDRASAGEMLTAALGGMGAIVGHDPVWQPKIVAYRQRKLQEVLGKIRQD